MPLRPSASNQSDFGYQSRATLWPCNVPSTCATVSSCLRCQDRGREVWHACSGDQERPAHRKLRRISTLVHVWELCRHTPIYNPHLAEVFYVRKRCNRCPESAIVRILSRSLKLDCNKMLVSNNARLSLPDVGQIRRQIPPPAEARFAKLFDRDCPNPANSHYSHVLTP